MKHDHSKKELEQEVNSWSIGDFFIGQEGDLYDNNIVLDNFANSLVYFWKIKFEKYFPNRNIKVEIKENYLGEYGKTIMVYEDTK